MQIPDPWEALDRLRRLGRQEINKRRKLSRVGAAVFHTPTANVELTEPNVGNADG